MTQSEYISELTAKVADISFYARGGHVHRVIDLGEALKKWMQRNQPQCGSTESTKSVNVPASISGASA